MFHKIMALSVFVLLGFAGVAAAGAGHPDADTVRAAFEHLGHSSASKPSASTSKPTPLLTFSMIGSGVAMDAIDGTCSGATCDASAGDCECIVIEGTLDATQVGKVPYTANVTVNLDDCINTGTTTPQANGFCCFGDGLLVTSPPNGKSSDALGMSFTGPVCSDPNSPPVDGGDTSVQGGFIVSKDNSSGKFANSGGAGQLNILVDVNNNTYLSGNGVLQVVSPF
jgi:hypothetical protein